jgi:8-hydroxy-5-deazaflavin:NADPH oxidoreductase
MDVGKTLSKNVLLVWREMASNDPNCLDQVVAEALPGGRLVKAFNTIYFETLAIGAKPGSSLEERIALPVAGDDVEAKKVVSDLIEQIGFAPVDTGRLAESKYQEPGQPLYDKDYKPADALRELARKTS